MFIYEIIYYCVLIFCLIFYVLLMFVKRTSLVYFPPQAVSFSLSINLSYLIKKKSLRPRELHQKEKVLVISDVTLQTCGVPFPYVRFPHTRSFYSTTLFDSDPKKKRFHGRSRRASDGGNCWKYMPNCGA